MILASHTMPDLLTPLLWGLAGLLGIGYLPILASSAWGARRATGRFPVRPIVVGCVVGEVVLVGSVVFTILMIQAFGAAFGQLGRYCGGGVSAIVGMFLPLSVAYASSFHSARKEWRQSGSPRDSSDR